MATQLETYWDKSIKSKFSNSAALPKVESVYFGNIPNKDPESNVENPLYNTPSHMNNQRFAGNLNDSGDDLDDSNSDQPK